MQQAQANNEKTQTATDQSVVRQPTVSALEEDDEFEEFDKEDWGENEEDKDDINLWEDNWDDDDLEDDFSKQLRVELAKLEQPQPMVETN
ncbi:26S proteasome complex subunit [Coemansia sp. RSA 2618]|nr:26S proteasome complex subunit [Coemansia sp. RSA 2618]